MNEPQSTLLVANCKTISFGEFPQTLKAADITITDQVDGRGYYLGSDGNYYNKVEACPYTDGRSQTKAKFNSNEIIIEGKCYYFKVEPIQWVILCESEDSALILCKNIIDVEEYHKDGAKRKVKGKTIYANNYEYSNIRAWLNNKFYNIAFSEFQKSLIQPTIIDNSENSTDVESDNPYACNNTNDNVFLLSCADVNNKKYGFNAKYNDKKRERPSTDYSRAKGVFVDRDDLKNSTTWWLRSPSADYGSEVYCVVSNSKLSIDSVYTYYSCRGIVPALTIRLNKNLND